MMIVWIIIELMFLFTFFNLPPVGETEEAKDIENSYKELKSNRSSLNGSISEQNVTEVSPLLKYSVHLQRERQVTIIDTSHKTNSVTTCYGCITWVCQKIQYLFILIKGLVYEESVLLLSILFIILFDDLVIEVRRVKCLYVHVLVYYITCKPAWFLCVCICNRLDWFLWYL